MKAELSNISKAYGKKPVLRGISLQAGGGECVGLLGGNGSGKSTLLSVLAGVLRPDSGSFRVDGEELIKDRRLRERMIGYVPQGTPLIDELSARDNLRLWYDAKELREGLSGGMIERLGVGEFLDVRVRKLSGGMKKRLSIACAVSGAPRILLLDEPTAALDLSCRVDIYRWLQEFKASGGLILLATHEVSEIEICDSLYILKDGTLKPYAYRGDLAELAGRL